MALFLSAFNNYSELVFAGKWNMLQRKLRLMLIISYYIVLIHGLMPTRLKISKSRVRIEKVSAGYLIYSVFVTVVLLLEVPYMMSSSSMFCGYMRNHILLQQTLIVTSLLRFGTILSCYGLVWLKRRRLIMLYKDFLVHWRTHWRILQRIAGAEAMERMQSELAGQLCRQLCVNYAAFCFSITMQYLLLIPRPQLLMRCLTMLMITAGRVGFSTLLLLLSHQFQAVQLALQALRGRMRSRSLEDLRRIAVVHSECLKLAKRAFSISDVANASLFFIMFALMVNILYHAVQFSNNTIQTDYFGAFIGEGLVVFNIWNSVMVMNMVDSTVNSCNNTSQMIRQFSDLHRISLESELELELFVVRLRSNRLVYRICGCVVLDKPACLGYMASVLGYVLILMQFDLKRRKDEGLKYDNFFKTLNVLVHHE